MYLITKQWTKSGFWAKNSQIFFLKTGLILETLQICEKGVVSCEQYEC